MKDINKNDVNSASAHTSICFLFSGEAHSNRLLSLCAWWPSQQ